jgi:PIN domain nuclease of toxin-antitoxin system
VPLLLDTNILIPLLEGQFDRMPKRIRESIVEPTDDLVSSVASLWEIAIKTRPARLHLSIPIASLPDEIDGLGMRLLIIDHRHVLAGLDPEPATRDPFDRLLLAQCQVEGMKLVTVDTALAAHPLAWREP